MVYLDKRKISIGEMKHLRRVLRVGLVVIGYEKKLESIEEFI